MKRKPRTLRVEVSDVDTVCSWGNSSITFKEYAEDGVSKKATIMIDRPGTLEYVRDQLNKIEAGWREDLKRLEPTRS